MSTLLTVICNPHKAPQNTIAEHFNRTKHTENSGNKLPQYINLKIIEPGVGCMSTNERARTTDVDLISSLLLL